MIGYEIDKRNGNHLHYFCYRASSTVLVPGHGQQSKATIVKQLNENPTPLSHDRQVIWYFSIIDLCPSSELVILVFIAKD